MEESLKKEKTISTIKPKVTVVTVTYNAEEFLERTIKSVIEQDYENIEYIIIDGGSTDRTVEIIRKYEKYISYWISEPDEGIYDAMNKGIDVATGEWINFMNAGDSFSDNNVISKIFFLKNLNSIIYGDYYLVSESGNCSYQNAKLLYEIQKHMISPHQSFFIEISLMKKDRFSKEYKIASDYDFLLKCYKAGIKFMYLKLPISKYLVGGYSESNKVQLNLEYMYIQSKYLSNIEKINNLAVYKKFILNSIDNMATAHILGDFYKKIDKLNLEDKKFVLYGFGTIGKLIYNQYYKNIDYILDKKFKSSTIDQHGTIYTSPDVLFDIKFDYIFISVLGREDNIKEEFIKKYFIENQQIIVLT
jgi:glycosyltransferase involved in cell wall biosynthesis